MASCMLSIRSKQHQKAAASNSQKKAKQWM